MWDFASRIERTLEALREHRCDALLVTASDHLRYLLGWCEPAGERFLGYWLSPLSEPVIVVPTLYREDVERRSGYPIKVLAYEDGQGWQGAVEAVVKCLGSAPKIAVDETLPTGHFLELQSLVRGAHWVSALPVMTAVRGTKCPEEVAQLERSAALADQVYTDTVSQLRLGVTERHLEEVIRSRFTELGAESCWAIVAFGQNTSMPHHRSGPTKLEAGMVVVLDLGGSLDGYQSDITRSFVVGQPDTEMKRVYVTVYDAHMRVREAARPGVRCCEVDAAARRVMEEAGLGQYFIHRTGHGIGLSVHEPPNLSANDTTPLEPGMCFSDEPGAYFPGIWGIRIENIITVEQDGARSLNQEPPATLPIMEL